MHVMDYMGEVVVTAKEISHADIEAMALALSQVKGRIYCIGLGGSLANAIHMAADFKKLCDLDAEAVANVSELTARANDDGMGTIFQGIKFASSDCLFVLSVGGGMHTVSAAITEAIRAAKEKGCKVFGIVGPNGGYTYEHADICIRIPVQNAKHITPHTEAFQAVIWHCLVSHPLLQKRPTKW